MHPVTRIGRVLQQLRSFTTLHAAELDGLAAELAAAGQAELAARLRVFQGLHTQEAALIVDELTDVQAELDREDDLPSPPRGPSIPMAPRPPLRAGEGEQAISLPLSAPERGPGGEVASVDPASIDHAAGSPKRARWLAEQARQAEEDRRPRSRRDLFLRGS